MENRSYHGSSRSSVGIGRIMETVLNGIKFIDLPVNSFLLKTGRKYRDIFKEK